MDYFEIECAKLHGGWGAWSRLPAVQRGRLLAHEMVKNMRTHYDQDQLRRREDKAKSKGDEGAPWSAMREQFFGKGCVNVGLAKP